MALRPPTYCATCAAQAADPIRHTLHCFVPPYMIERLANARDPAIRQRAMANLVSAASFRTQRQTFGAFASLMTPHSPQGTRHRLVYSARGTQQLPGRLVRAEGDPPRPRDPAVNEAYEHSGITWDFYDQLFQRNSLDNRGMTLVSSVHLAEPGGEALNNAFWNGRQMAYGDGDGVLFGRFTQALEVVGHELTHGVQSFTSNLEYRGESGALNEHFADVFGILIKQWHLGQRADRSDWLVGADVLVPLPPSQSPTPSPIQSASQSGARAQSQSPSRPQPRTRSGPVRRAIRDMLNPGTAYRNDPLLGTDPQPAHYAKRYLGELDNGGVHLNSGIANRAFALAALALGGNAWEVTGRIWYETMTQLQPHSGFADCARLCVRVATAYGETAAKAVRAAWEEVGVPPGQGLAPDQR